MKNKKGKIVLVVILAVIAILMLFTYVTKKVENRMANLDSELLRSKNYAQVTDEQSKVENTDFVKFSAFFTRDINGDGNAEKLLGTCKRVIGTDQLYMDLNVLTNGYLKDGKITINGTNFKYSMSMVKDSVLKNNYISDDVKVIELNNVNAGTQKLIIGNIVADIGNNVNNYSSVSSVTFTGTHVSDDGVETEISKTVDLTVDWYGEAKTELYMNYGATKFSYYYDELDSTTISFNFRLDEIQKELILKENKAVLTIPELNGYAPTEVECTNSNIESEYNNETKELTIKRNSVIDDSGIVTIALPYNNSYTVNITYPQEAYDKINQYKELTIPVTGYYIGYNNSNKEFDNPYKSNIVNNYLTLIFKSKPTDKIYNFSVDFIDKSRVTKPDYRYVISKQEILNYYDNNAEVKNKEYEVRWLAIRGNAGEVSSMVMSETKSGDAYGDKWNENIMQEYVVNTGIYFENADNILNENGFIYVYNDDTNELIHTFTKEEWNKYTKAKPYKYETPVRHIRVETTETKLNSTLSVYNIRELEVDKVLEDFTKEQVKDIYIVYTYLTGTCNIVGQGSETINDVDYAYYVSEKSDTKVSVSKNNISTQETIESQKIYIDTIYNQTGDSKWKNGEFIVEIPQEIANIKINNINASNNVQVIAYDLFEQDNKYFIKIITENEKETTYTITIDCNMTPDPRTPTTDKEIKLYSYNENCNDYYFNTKDIYDVDSDNNVQENVGISSEVLNLISPTSLITLETISNYNDKNETTVAPNIAPIEKETKQATINVSFTNNYSNTVSGIQILGKIPFEGNSYILNGRDLKSKFTVSMASEGIIIPQELVGKVSVYYSQNENPTKDLLDENNGWKLKEDISDFTKIRTYFIDLNQNVIETGRGYTFNYVINIPENLNYNISSYSNHAIYYELNTDGGKLALATEPNKVGVRISKKVDFELTKYKEGTESLIVPGATYTLDVSEDDETIKTRILTTNNEGKICVKNIYVGLKYTIKELKSPIDYKLSDKVIEFTVVEENDVLKLQTEYSNANIENNTVKVKVEDEPKYNLNIKKVDNTTGKPIDNIIFIADGNSAITNRNGDAIIKRLEINKKYTLKEQKSDDYYTLENINFKLTKDETGKLIIESENENFKNAIIENNNTDNLINIFVTLNNEKIPRFDLKIVKVKEDSNESDSSKLEPLRGAKFRLTSEDSNKQDVEYITDESGIINIYDLYQYVDGKEITGNYILQEIKAPDGYSNNAEEIKFKVTKNAENNLEINIENREQLETIRDIKIENDIISLIIQNKPLFKLTKVDDKTGESLANTKFVIYKIDSEGHELEYAKDVNGNYVGELDEYGRYILTTNENGEIILPLQGGLYKAVEVEYLEGYEENNVEKIFEVEGNNEKDDEVIEDENVVEISSIEDLVDFSKAVNNGNTYENVTVKLTRNLDFNEQSSYKNYQDTSYGDLNENGKVESIMEELTNKDGIGFTPIGYGNNIGFSGNFDGESYEIRNIYIHPKLTKYDISAIGLFVTTNGIVKNLGISGKIYGGLTGGITAKAKGNVINCYNKCEIYSIYGAGGIVGEGYRSNISNCYNIGTINGFGDVGGISSGGGNIDNCYNLGKIINIPTNGGSMMMSFAGGIVGEGSGINISNCYNAGEIVCKQVNGTCVAGGISGRASKVSNCYNIGDIICNGSELSYDTAGGILGSEDYNSSGDIVNCYYNKDIVLECNNIFGNICGAGIAISDEYMLSREFYDKLNLDNVWTYRLAKYPTLNVLPVNVKKTTEIIIENSLKEFKVTTEIGINSESKREGGTIFYENNNSENLNFVENILYKNDNTREIRIKANDDYHIDKILINSEEVDFSQTGDKEFLIPKGYFKDVTEDKHIIVIFEKIDNFIINKVDENDSSKKLQGTKFAIYKLSEYYETIDFIKNNKNEYLGKQNENGIYELETDADGKIKLELAPGLYKAVETKSAEGYALEESEALRTTYFRVEEENKEDEGNTNINNADFVINNIEDLVRFSNDVNSGNSYEGKTVVLARTLDFNEDGSYNNPEDTTFGDYNGDGTVEGIKQELAKEEGTGFKAVGNDTNPFKGTFNGNEYEIKNINIYANGSSLYGGIIGKIVSGKIMNLGIVDAKIICDSKTSGGIVGNATDSEIINCYNKGNLTTKARAPVEGIAGEITNSKIIRCYNEANITGNCTTGIVYYAKDSIIENCYNAGDLNSTAPVGGIAFQVSNSEIIDCYNEGEICSSDNEAVGIARYITNSKIFNCYNTGKIIGGVPAGGIVEYASDSEIINCYNNGEISGKYGSGGIVGNSLSNSKIINCYNTGKIIDADSLLGGIVGPNITNSTLNKCYYLNSSATQGVYNQKDIEGQVEAKTQEAMQSEEFVKQLNINKDNTNAQIPLSNWSYNEEGYPTLLPLEIKSGKQLTITNKKLQNNLTIKKVDKETKQKLSGAKFRLEANKDSLIGGMVSNSQYTFEKRGTQYISNNNGKSNSVANAYFPIDLSSCKGTYELNVDYTISSESGGDIGYATITTSANIPTYNENEYDISKSYQFIYRSGSSSNKASIDLIGGKKYYLHIGYRKNSSTNSGNDRFYINDISLKHNLDVATNEDGIIDICLPSGEYKIKETSAPYGYNLSNEEKTVLISGIDDVQELTFENEKLQTKYNEPNVIITKKDKATGEIMSGVKFMVLDEQGNYIKDYTGTIVGEQEEIDGQDKYVVTTDENGQIKLKLNIGKYQLVEVKSLEGYALEDKKNFEITNEDEDYEVSGEGIIISTNYPWKNYIIATSDGGMIETNYGTNKTISARYTVDNKELDVTSDNGYVVKYNNSGKIENLIQISGLNYGAEIYEDTEGNFIVLGGGKQIEIPAEKTIDNEPIKLEYNGTNLRTIILKLNKDLKVIWVKNIDSFYVSPTSPNYTVENKEGNYIINFNGYSGNNIEIPAKDTVNGEKISSQRNANSVLIEYTKDGKVKNIYQNSYGIDSLIEKDSGGYIISSGSVIYELDSKMNEVRRYSNNISGISSGSSYATKDEGFIIGGNITSSNITISGENTASGNPISVTSDITPAIVLVKYDKNFKVEWAKAKSWSRSNEYVNRIKQDNQGNYIVLSGLKLIKYSSNGDNITTVDLPSDMPQYGYLYTDRTNSKFVILDGNNNFRVYTLGTGNFTPITLEITNQKAGKVIVHHYLQGTGEEFGTTPEKISEDEVINGKVPEEYTTSPNMQIKDYTLIKDEKGDYIIPSNASGTYTEQDQHVYYYYNKTPLKLTVHHYLEGTQEKLAEDEQKFYTEGDHYKTNASEEVLKKYNLTNVIGDEEKDITQNEEVTYYYQIKTHQITTKVEIPEGRAEKGGTITGEGEKPYETVDYEQSSKKDIIITPEKGYKVKQIKLVSTSEDGQKTESTIYGNDETEGSELTYTEGENNTITLTKFQNMIADKEIIVIFEPDEGRLIVHHYIEESTEKIYDDQITVKPVGTKVETVPVKKDNYAVVKEPEDRNATIIRETQEKIYYYQKQYNITTEVIKHNETYKDGTIVKNVKGGTITDEGKKSHEYVLKNRNSQNEVIITPNDGYEIVKITINNETLDYKNLLDEKGKVTIPKEFFKNVQEDKHIQVEFRKKTKVYVKYLEEGTEQPLYTEENKDYIELNGYEGQEYETVKKVIPNYKDSTLGITDENKLQVQPKGIMYADDVTVIYWYTRVSSGIIVRHIETNEKGEEIELENNVIDGLAGLNQLTNRNKYDKYIPVDRKQENSENVNSHITIAKKEENSKTITFAQDKILEVWYFYEKQYDVTTSVKTHEEKVLNETTGKYETKQIAGGTISKEYEKDEQGNDKLDDKGNKIEITYEQILSRGDSKKQIELKPDENYRVKSVIKQKKIIKNGKEQYEEEQIFVEDNVQEDGSVILPEKLLVDVQNDYNIQVEFEKIPAKVIVQYKDAYTKESIHEDKILEGFVNDEYNEQRISIENYIPADPEPENNYGKMTKEPITVTYWYTKQFKITAEVKPHEEELNNETGEIEKVQKEGGTIKIGENLLQELVTRGDNSINTIIAIPDQNYRIKYVTINGKEIDLAKVLQENGTAKLPLFENMQEDKHIVVEFERIPTKLIVKHLDVETNNPITEDEQKDGFVGENYKTNPLNTKFYKLVDEKYPQNSEGKLTNEETIVTYYYEKLPFNLKIQKEVSNVLVNGEKLNVEENNIPMIIIAYKDIKDTTITIEYKIKVTNTESIAGKAVIEEKIPKGFELATESNPNWKKTEDTYTLQTDEILPGETKEYVVVLNWEQDTQNEGYKSNEAKIISTENEPKFDETTVLDNKDDAVVQIIINKTLQDVVDDIKDGNTKEVIKDIARSVKTGDAIIVSLITLAVFGTVLVIVFVKRKNER